jgi:hypothetical protein
MTAPTTTADERRMVLAGMAQALAQLSVHVERQGEAALGIADLVTRAEAIAAEAWTVSCADGDAGTRAEALARELDGFVADATQLAQRGARDAASSREVARSMRSHAVEFAHAARDLNGVDDLAQIRARLGPLAAALGALPARVQAGAGLAGEVAALGDQASAIAERSESLHRDPRHPNAAAIELYRALHDFADSAAAIAVTMRVEADHARRAIADMAVRADRLVARGPFDGASHVSPTERLRESLGPARPPRDGTPRTGMRWGDG